MPLLLALPVGLLLGMSLSWIARQELSRSEVPLVLARPFLVSAALGLVVYAPVVGYFAALHGDWAYLYLFAWSRVPSAIDLALAVLAGSSVPAGFALASEWAMARRGAALLRTGAVIGLVVVVACAVSAKRLAVSASFAQYHGGFGVTAIGRSSLGRGVLLSWVTILAGYAWSVRLLRSRGPSA